MKKIIAGSGVAAVAALTTWGFATPAQAYPNDTPPGGTTPTSAVLGSGAGVSAGASPSSGVLPNTGGPETSLLLGGAALLAVGGVAVAVAKRRQTDA